MKIDIWHNILWSSYKAEVFNEIDKYAKARCIDVIFYQIAETEMGRAGLGVVDMTRHNYPMDLIFTGSYDNVPLWKRVWELAHRSATTNADVVILAGYDRLEYVLQALILLIKGTPFAVFCDSTRYDNKHSLFKYYLKRTVFKIYKFVFCYGERARDYVVGLGVKPENTIHRCQAAALPKNYDQSTVVARRLSAANDWPLFLYVGRFSSEKRIDNLIFAFSKVRGTLPVARLRLVGVGPQLLELQALAQKLGCAEAVEFTGGQSHDLLFSNYYAATALVLPSWSEPWGLVVNEALHSGCPVIVSNRCGCVPELVEGSECGLVFQCEDVEELAEKLIKGAASWRDRRAVAEACLEQIAEYSPRNAAKSIMDGVLEIAARTLDH